MKTFQTSPKCNSQLKFFIAVRDNNNNNKYLFLLSINTFINEKVKNVKNA